jgi:uncharacterized protein (DUF362 family)
MLRRVIEADIVSLVKFDGDLQQTLRQGLGLLDLQIPSDRPILIKPNLCEETDETGASTTSIPFVRALMEVILGENRRASLRIVESDSTGKSVEVAFRNLGYVRLVDEFREHGFDVSLVNLSKEPLVTVMHQGLCLRKVRLPKLLVEPRFLISVARAKALIGLTTITGVLKNQFGCLPEKNKFRYHHRHLDEVIVDVNMILRPDLCIVDAIVGQETPHGGKTHRIGVVIFGRAWSPRGEERWCVLGDNYLR